MHTYLGVSPVDLSGFPVFHKTTSDFFRDGVAFCNPGSGLYSARFAMALRDLMDVSYRK